MGEGEPEMDIKGFGHGPTYGVHRQQIMEPIPLNQGVS
jgi:hypothetical protein